MTDQVEGQTGHASPIPREARPYQGRRAGMVTRVLASGIDAVVVVVLVVAGCLALNGVVLLLRPRSFSWVSVPQLSLLTATLATAVVYFTAAWCTVGRTYGCHVMGLRIVNRHGRTPGLLVSLLRAVFCVLFPVGLLWCAVGSSRRSVQDVVLRTSAVYDWLPRPAAGAQRSSSPRR